MRYNFYIFNTGQLCEWLDEVRDTDQKELIAALRQEIAVRHQQEEEG